MTTKNAFDVLKERGFIKQCTDEEAVRELFEEGPVTAYIGYDPTATSLHIGNLFVTMALMHLERLGHRPLVVVGGATAMVGDPSGKTEMRQMMTGDTIGDNVSAIKQQLSRFLTFEEGKSILVNNADWLMEFKYIDFLRDVGRHFSVNRMLAAESYKQRLERGLSFIEFNYQILQAYDFMELRRRHGCVLQMGGDDQWGNILAGVDLTRRIDSELVHGLTFPLLLTSAGEKMGKTAKGALWLDADRVSPYEFYQYWVNVDDADLEKTLGFLTFLPMEEVRTVTSLQGRELNMAKSILAYEVTKLVHGKEEAAKAHQAAQSAFGSREIPAELLVSSDVPRKVVANTAQIPTKELANSELAEGVTLVDMMVQVGFDKSKGAARRLINQGAVRINDVKITDGAYALSEADFQDGAMTLRSGKKKVHRVVLKGA